MKRSNTRFSPIEQVHAPADLLARDLLAGRTYRAPLETASNTTAIVNAMQSP
jgi:hypothetical protein